MIGRAVLLRDLPPSSAVLFRCWAAAMVGPAVLVRDPPPWVVVWCWCVTRRHGRACCGGAEPTSDLGS